MKVLGSYPNKHQALGESRAIVPLPPAGREPGNNDAESRGGVFLGDVEVFAAHTILYVELGSP